MEYKMWSSLPRTRHLLWMISENKSCIQILNCLHENKLKIEGYGLVLVFSFSFFHQFSIQIGGGKKNRKSLILAYFDLTCFRFFRADRNARGPLGTWLLYIFCRWNQALYTANVNCFWNRISINIDFFNRLKAKMFFFSSRKLSTWTVFASLTLSQP